MFASGQLLEVFVRFPDGFRSLAGFVEDQQPRTCEQCGSEAEAPGACSAKPADPNFVNISEADLLAGTL